MSKVSGSTYSRWEERRGPLPGVQRDGCGGVRVRGERGVLMWEGWGGREGEDGRSRVWCLYQSHLLVVDVGEGESVILVEDERIDMVTELRDLLLEIVVQVWIKVE